MNRIAAGLAGVALIGTAAHADDHRTDVTVKNDRDHRLLEKKTKHGKHKRLTKVESKSRHRLGGGRVDTTETTREHRGPGGHRKEKVTETKERDAHGDVVREEKKVDR